MRREPSLGAPGISPFSALLPTFWHGKNHHVALASLSISVWQQSFQNCFFFSLNSIKSFVAYTMMSICLPTQPHGTAICTYQPHFSTELKLTLKLLDIWLNGEKFRIISTEGTWSNHSKWKNRCRREGKVPNLCAKLCKQVSLLLCLWNMVSFICF